MADGVESAAEAADEVEDDREPDQKPELKNKDYMKELRRLQAGLCDLQEWVKKTGARIIVVLEGRDAAGKGGTIKAITERVSPRVFRVVALPAPSDREKSQMYIQRYFAHFPAAGEIVIFDRSWYNRAGVEYVLGFCTKEQRRRFLDRLTEPGKEWKFSSADVAERQHWDAYMDAYEKAITATSTPWAPWYVIPADNKNLMRMLVAGVVVHTVRSMKLTFPTVGEEQHEANQEARRQLEAETS